MHTYTRHYRTFRQYFNKNRRTYKFEIKMLNMIMDKSFIEETLKPLLEPLDIVSMSEPTKDFLHENPVEFPIEPWGIVSSIEVELGMSATASEIKMLIFEGLKLPFKNFIVYNLHDPSRKAKKEYQALQDSLLDNYNDDQGDYHIPRLGYDIHDETISPQELVGNTRIAQLMKTVTQDEYKPQEKLFKFFDEE